MTPESVYKKKSSLFAKVFDITINVVLVALLGLLVVYLLYSPIVVSGISMENTLYDGEQVAISNFDKNYSVGDIVVIDKGEYNIIKRIVAVAGDKIAFAQNKDGYIEFYRNDWNNSVQEPYMKEPMTGEKFLSMSGISGDGGEIIRIAPSQSTIEKGNYIMTIPDGTVFVMGDNRNHSDDSRKNGVMKIDSIRGKMKIVISGNAFWETVFGLSTNKINKEKNYG